MTVTGEQHGRPQRHYPGPHHHDLRHDQRLDQRVPGARATGRSVQKKKDSEQNGGPGSAAVRCLTRAV